MNVAFNKIDNVTAKITLSIEEADYLDGYKKNLKEAGKKYQVPGFRPGHVPAGMLKKMFGTQAKANAIDEIIQEELFKAIQEQKLNILGQPLSANEEKIDLNDANLTFTFEVGFVNDINIEINKDITIPYYTIDVNDEMIDKQSDALRKRFSTQVAAEEADATAFVKMNVAELDENGAVKADGITSEGTSILLSHINDEETKNLFIGKKVGDKVVFNAEKASNNNAVELASLLSIEKEEAANVKSNFEATIESIKVAKDAEIGNELFEMAFGKECTTEEQYRANIKDMITKQLVGDSNYRFTVDTELVLEQKIGEIELPNEFLKRWLLTQDSKKYNAENIDAEYEKMVPGLKWQLIKETIVNKLGIKVEQEDVLVTAKILAAQQFAQYGMANVPEDVIERYAQQMLEDKQYGGNIRNQAVEDKMYGAIREQVTIEDKTVSVDEFNALFAPAEKEAE